MRTGFFSVLESNMLTLDTINEACTSVGVAKYGRAIGLDEKIKVDLIVIGSVAVDPNTGARLGKGEVHLNAFHISSGFYFSFQEARNMKLDYISLANCLIILACCLFKYHDFLAN